MKISKEAMDRIKFVMLDTIVLFCENAAELGCPREEEVDMWIRNLAMEEPDRANGAMEKLIEISRRNEGMYEKEKVKKVKKGRKLQKTKKNKKT